jgi:hypothetical protein
MATSGVTTYSVGRDDLIDEALQLCGAIEEGQTASADMTASAQRTLNMMIKAWMAEGVHLFGLQEVQLFLTEDQEAYTLTSTGDRASADVVEATLTTDAASGAVSIGVLSTGMVAADYIGIELDSGDMHWTTVSSVPSSGAVNLASALTDDAASGNAVYAFTSKLYKPLRIPSARIVADGIETPLSMVSRQEYFDLPDKTSSGRPTLAYYDPQRVSGTLYVWPSPDSDLYRVKMTVERTLEDMEAAGDNPDFPIEWAEAISLNLALRLSRKYRAISFEKRMELKEAAMAALDAVQAFDNEITSLFLTPDCR